MSNVKLAVRVRPFSERELKSEKDKIPVVSVVDHITVSITNIKVSTSGAGDSRERVRTYNADYTFDSSCSRELPTFATQESVFESIGRDVMSCVSHGQSACVLAYGQSATGKTHTMLGTDSEPGLVPRLCAALFEDDVTTLITVSFLEIYNERVHDLLAGEDPLPACSSLPRRRGNARKDLRVREHPDRGTYVQNLRRVAVHDVHALLALVSEGTRRRRTASTKRNPTSSRSHALLELTTAQATLHLADLAGSEKAGWEGGGTGGRQKEGANINKSLVALSNVISALVNVGVGRGRFVPFRDSALTWLLKDCFTGGARTFIIATVSPSAACYGESASTLRWTARARQLPASRPPQPAPVCRGALQAQLERLIAELARNHIRYIPETGKISYDDCHWNIILNKNCYQKHPDNKTTINMDTTKQGFEKVESTSDSIARPSSDVISVVDNKHNLTRVISKEMDKLFGPSLERTSSGSDLKIVAPFRVKRRQYRSTEVLPIEKTLLSSNTFCSNDSLGKDVDQIQTQFEPSVQEPTMNKTHLQVPILYDNQRAEIVASVTERLYSKLKKKEESAVAKMESVVDRKIMEPLSELRICTNARQRLMELSQKALRSRRRIGIPAFTQTKKQVIRVKDQAVEVQTDLLPYYVEKRETSTLQKDIGTETVPFTPRCKEIAVGPKCGSLAYKEISTSTETKDVMLTNSFVMTDTPLKCDQYTQTNVVPPPRRKRRPSAFTKYLKTESRRINNTENTASPVISINISQEYPTDTEYFLEDGIPNNRDSVNVTIPPDLLTNHSAVESNIDSENESKSNETYIINSDSKELEEKSESYCKSSKGLIAKSNDEFPLKDYPLPRVCFNFDSNDNQKDMKDMILGHNKNVYPYNIILSPPRERETNKRTVTFQDIDKNPIVSQSISTASQTSWDTELYSKDNIDSDVTSSEKDELNCKSDTMHPTSSSESVYSSKAESDIFIWNKGPLNYNNNNTVTYPESRKKTRAYKTNIYRRRTAKAKIYREFLGLDKAESDSGFRVGCNSSYTENEEENKLSMETFKQKRKFFEEKFGRESKPLYSFGDIEKNVAKSCDRIEKSVYDYDKYLEKYRVHCKKSYDNDFTRGNQQRHSPKEHLHNLVEIRKQMIKESDDEMRNALSFNSIY